MGCLPKGDTLERRDKAEAEQYREKAAENARALASKVVNNGVEIDEGVYKAELTLQKDRIKVILENRTSFIYTLDELGFVDEGMHDTDCDGKVAIYHSENRAEGRKRQIKYENLLRTINLNYDREIFQARLNQSIIHTLSEATLWKGDFVNHDLYNLGIDNYDASLDLRDPIDGEMFCITDNTTEYCEYGIPNGFLENCTEIESGKECDQKRAQADYSQALRGAYVLYKWGNLKEIMH